jgi:hypothetical protein
VDRATGIVTQETHVPGASNAITARSRAGLVLWRLGPESSNSAHAVTSSYDGLDRLVLETHGATGVQREILYDPVSGRVSTERSWGGAASYAAATVKTSTSYAYIANGTANAGRVSSRTTDGQATSYAYTARGELLATWGVVYPVKYEYDEAGRLWKMRTYRTDPGSNPGTWPAGDVTEWVYHAGIPLLQQKLDAAGQGATYTYDATGRMATRAWARSVGTTYSYNLADEVRFIDYSDTTPDVTITHTSDGKTASVSDGTGARYYGYTGERLVAETHGSGGSLVYTHDVAGRRTGYALWGNNGGTPQWVAWGATAPPSSPDPRVGRSPLDTRTRAPHHVPVGRDCESECRS